MIPSGYNMNDLYREAQYRWLKPAEVLYILQNHVNHQLSNEPPQLPPSGTLFLFNKRILRFFRRDGHNWRKKKDQKTVGEAHERLKVGNVETLNCYYAHGEDNPNFQRRSYWILDPVYEHIVLVHYRDINERKSSPGSIASASILNSSPIPTLYSTTQNQGGTSIMTDLQQSIISPGSVEVSSEVVYSNNVSDDLQRVRGGEPISFEQGLQKLKLQLSLDDDIIKENGLFSGEDEYSDSAGYLDFGAEMANQQQLFLDDPGYSASYQLPPENSGKQDDFSDFVVLQGIDENCATVGDEDSLLTEMLEPWFLSSSSGSMPQGKLGYEWSETTNDQVENFKIPAFPSEAEIGTSTEYYQLFFDQSMPPEAPNLTVSQVQKYTIQEISPEWGYDSEPTKVIIIGSFLCDTSVYSWTCMFGDVEVPVEIIKEGVLCCEAPPCAPGKVTVCITTGNRESCSEIREFEYRAKSDICPQCKSAPSEEAPATTEDLLPLVKFVQMLICDLPMPQEDSEKKSEDDSDSFNRTIEALLDGTGVSSETTSFLLNALIKDKLHQWISIRTKEGDDQKNGCSLSKKEQGIIHMVAALGFEWALNPVLDRGVNVNFRDINGWTALHWAARFGREKVVAALIASGAYAGAVTDPSEKDPSGKTSASIAASNGYKGLAGYLSEVSLTTHLSSLTLEEFELSKSSAEVEAEQTLNSVSGEGIVSSDEDHLSVKHSLDAVRNARQAAARIQAAFRAHSFRKRMQREGANGTDDDYGISLRDMQAISRVASSSGRDHNLAALSIQKKYRGWKGRKDFLALRKKVINIQAHVRGYQVRKSYKVICWAVGVLDKVVLRWRRKGIGLKNFLSERGSSDDDDDGDDEEDILKLFRAQIVDPALDEAVARVVSMAASPDARHQYRRLLEGYRRAKGELKSEASPSNSGDFTEDMVTS